MPASQTDLSGPPLLGAHPPLYQASSWATRCCTFPCCLSLPPPTDHPNSSHAFFRVHVPCHLFPEPSRDVPIPVDPSLLRYSAPFVQAGSLAADSVFPLAFLHGLPISPGQALLNTGIDTKPSTIQDQLAGSSVELVSKHKFYGGNVRSSQAGAMSCTSLKVLPHHGAGH